MRLIDADWVAERLKEWRNWIAETYGENDDYVLCLDTVLMKLDDAPTADVEPVKHGHWTIEDIITYERSYGGILYEPVYKCSCCGRVTESYVRGDEPIMPEDADFPEFCGNCGAKMDEAKDGKI